MFKDSPCLQKERKEASLPKLSRKAVNVFVFDLQCRRKYKFHVGLHASLKKTERHECAVQCELI